MVDTKNLSSQPTVRTSEPETIFVPIDGGEWTFSCERNEYWCREFREVVSSAVTTEPKFSFDRETGLMGFERPVVAPTDNNRFADLYERERDQWRKAFDQSQLDLQQRIGERDALQAEVDEQCRLNGMGAQRELRLMTERDDYKAEVERLGEQAAVYFEALVKIRGRLEEHACNVFETDLLKISDQALASQYEGSRK